ncbi:Cupin domain-containing protein [Klenkia soli]|uniref:Cupin domain-containing protein n=1 Tax=Klenkia soli TaxID=1052260 RepID=A0A1H0G1T7_9ACTN|nr:cupin domain-containing protein [Klenkia soli]SDO00853.1 Cupin domain-containing protein [Klenkia soli]
MQHIITADVPAVLEHDDTVASYFMLPMESMREATQGSHLQFVNEFTVDPLKAIEPHFHDSHEFYYVLSGRGTMRVGTDVYVVTPGDLVHTPPNVPHSIFAHHSGVRCLAFAVSFAEKGQPAHTPVHFDDWPPPPPTPSTSQVSQPSEASRVP